jgi:hypothetical protein
LSPPSTTRTVVFWATPSTSQMLFLKSGLRRSWGILDNVK